MVDKVVIDGILANLQLYVAQLDRLSKLRQDEFLISSHSIFQGGHRCSHSEHGS